MKFSSTRANETNDDEELWDVERKYGRKNKENEENLLKRADFFR